MAIWTARDMPQQDGKRVLVTGGVAGIGFQVAKAMGEKGARVLIASRDVGKGARALAEVRAAVPAGEFSFGRLD
ncbi:NAD(P)-dependent dehydrogenase (short-subunit alcohol dehydrogenase family) [Rhizobium sp. BK313]|nr:NAD(P)-dependent dehydrogenase (short-subunit alcohol dehydrogenase family) [Rhizobium sp. BK313]